VTHRSIKVKLHGWFPYLYVKAPEGWIDSSAHHDCIRLAMREGLALELEENKPLQKLLFKERFQEPIISMELVVGTDIMGFHPSNEGQLFLKQSIVSPLFITPLRNCWEGGHHIRVGERGIPEVRPGSTPTFNSNLDPVLQFMVDKGVSGCQWCRVCLDEEGCAQDSHCDYEIQCEVSKLQVLSLEERSDLGPLRILSFDLEAAGRRGVFPDPMVDPVIQISIHFEPKRDPILLSFKECSPIEGAHVFCFEKEDELLLAFRDIVVHFDADILTGYNICNFDMEYLQKRAVALEIGTEFALMTRMRKVKMTVQELFFQSAQVLLHFPPRLFFSVTHTMLQVGKRKSNRVSVRGRAVLDVYLWMLNNFRLDEYKLDAVCRTFLGDHMTKEDLHFTEITPKWLSGTYFFLCPQPSPYPLDGRPGG